MQVLEFADFDNDLPVRALIREYIDLLPFDITYQRFDRELDDLASLYSAAARGALFIATENGTLAGCVAIKQFDGKSCEMKRLYVRSSFRGRKLGRLLTEAAIQKAQQLHYRFIKLDTEVRAHAVAISLYRKLGFRETKAYHTIPLDLLFMELDLQTYSNQRS